MKILHFYFLLLFMVLDSKCDNNSTTISGISLNSTIVAATLTTTLPPTTTTTTTPSTTTTAAITTTTPYDDSKNFDYQVCGNVTYQTDCSCNNGTLTCTPAKKPCYYWSCYYDPEYYPSFLSTNIKIMNDSFVVKTINFFNNKLITLKKDKIFPGHEHTVEVLQLTDNKIYTIENGTFNKFTALKELVLTRNSLRKISAEVFTPELGSTLERLYVSSNEVDSIFDLDFSNLVQLKFLKLYNNPRMGSNDSMLKYIFPEALANLTTLDFGECGIVILGDDTFINLKSLKTLILYNNPIITFPKGIHHLHNLEYLNMDNTNVVVLNYTGYNFTTKLQKLHMLRTSLTLIDDCAFCNFPELKELLMYTNPHLTYIHENAFGYAYNDTSPPLEKFSVEQCNLSTIPEELLNWHNISQFGLGDNPFMCNCSMAWLINDLLSPTHSVNLKDIAPQPYHYSWEPKGVEFKCIRPFALKGIPFVQLSRNFCPNEVKKEKPVKEKIIIVTEPSSPFNISWFHVSVIIVASLSYIFIGMIFIPLLRYLCRRRPKIQPTNGFFNQNFHDDMNHEDFDENEKA